MIGKHTKPLFTVTRVLIALFCFGFVAYLISEGVLISWQPIMVRAATPDDEIRSRYFGISSKGDPQIRNIAVLEGTFTKSTFPVAYLYLVRDGKVDDLAGFDFGRSTNQIGGPIWIHMRITLALGDTKWPNGRVTKLGFVGESRAAGHTNDFVHDIQIVEKKTLPGRLSSGKKYILHVEGDRKFEVSRDMSVEDFAKANAGNFVVVVVQLN